MAKSKVALNDEVLEEDEKTTVEEKTESIQESIQESTSEAESVEETDLNNPDDVIDDGLGNGITDVDVDWLKEEIHKYSGSSYEIIDFWIKDVMDNNNDAAVSQVMWHIPSGIAIDDKVRDHIYNSLVALSKK